MGIHCLNLNLYRLSGFILNTIEIHWLGLYLYVNWFYILDYRNTLVGIILVLIGRVYTRDYRNTLVKLLLVQIARLQTIGVYWLVFRL